MSVEAVMSSIEAGSAPAVAPAPTPSADPVKPEETTAAVPPAELPPTDQPIEAEPETEVDLDATPDSSGDFSQYKPLFKDHPELRSIVGREKAYSELGNFSEVKAIVERIPTIEDAETLASQAENHATMGQTFREDPATFVESLKESDPLAFQQFATELPNVLAQTDPKLYREQAITYTNRVMSNAFDIAQRSGDADLMAAVQKVVQFLGIRPGDSQPAQPDTSEAARLRKQIAARDQSDATQKFESFWQQTDSTVMDNCAAVIDKTLKQALPDATPQQQRRMGKEIYDAMLETLNSQPQFTSQLEIYRKNAEKGRQGMSEHKAIVDFVTRRANLVIPKVAKNVIGEWSKEVLRLNNGTTEKKKDIAARTKDVGSGPQGTTSAAAPTNNGNGKPRSMSSIFEQIESGNYVRK